jgi:hypothetical protein
MKNLITAILLLFTTLTYSQTSYIDLKPINTSSITLSGNGVRTIYNTGFRFNFKTRIGSNVDIRVGIGMMLGGVVFTTAGLLTTSVTEENQYGEIVNKPFWAQGSKMLAITSGVGLFVGGITVTLSGN